MTSDAETPVAGLVSLSQDVHAAMRRIDPMQSRIIRMIYFERRTEQQVADELRLPRLDVARTFACGLQALAALMLAPAAD